MIPLKWIPNCKKTPKYECLELSPNIFDAFKTQIKAECGDKTFLLIIIFTITWSNWHLDMDRPHFYKSKEEKQEVEDDKKEEDFKPVDGTD